MARPDSLAEVPKLQGAFLGFRKTHCRLPEFLLQGPGCDPRISKCTKLPGDGHLRLAPWRPLPVHRTSRKPGLLARTQNRDQPWRRVSCRELSEQGNDTDAILPNDTEKQTETSGVAYPGGVQL